MLSRRDKLLNHPWEVLRFENHKRKIQSARPAIDDKSPKVYPHITTKLKKMQYEKERLDKINKDNVKLLQRLGSIMTSKRIENFWQHPRPNFLNREKIDFKRPKTCKGRLESLAVTIEFNSSASSVVCSPKTTPERKIRVNNIRCPTCAGRPVKKNQIIPEERIPWAPPRSSWNRKIYTKEFETHKCCTNCCID